MVFFLIVLWVVISIVVELAAGTGGFSYTNVRLLTPSYFYDKGMNWFGAYFCTILIGIVSPAMFIFKLLRWLFTVGR